MMQTVDEVRKFIGDMLSSGKQSLTLNVHRASMTIVKIEPPEIKLITRYECYAGKSESSFTINAFRSKKGLWKDVVDLLISSAGGVENIVIPDLDIDIPDLKENMERIDEIIEMFEKAECPDDWAMCPLWERNDCDNFCPLTEAADMLREYKRMEHKKMT